MAAIARHFGGNPDRQRHVRAQIHQRTRKPAFGESGIRVTASATASARELSGGIAAFRIIQGGMGSGVSGWRLARAVSLAGQLGVVSGSGLDTLLVRQLQAGDHEGHLRRAMAAFPVQGVAERVLNRHFRVNGRGPAEPYDLLPLDGRADNRERQDLIVLAGFVEAWLAKEGHDRAVGLNLLTKIQMPNLATLYGAMLAGIDVVLMGAGIPRDIPAALDALALHHVARLRMDVVGSRPEDSPFLTFDPGLHGGAGLASLRRPYFLPIVSSNLLATAVVRKSTGRVDGLVIEAPTAGGHNAPPRGRLERNERGEPLYGERDAVDLARIRELGMPFWLAGGAGRPGKLAEAIASGAEGIQVGTLFAFCRESGLRDEYRRAVIDASLSGSVDVFTDAAASPTGFPFKVVQLPGTLSDDAMYEARERKCDLGYLRTAYVKDGRIGFRCPAEPVDAHVAKGGTREDTVGRRCLCNALLENVGYGQIRKDGRRELPLLTSGDELRALGVFLAGRTEYSARDVIDHLLA